MLISEELRWLIGISVTLCLGWGGILVTSFRSLNTNQKKAEEESRRRDEALHSRINRVREETVHKSDLDGLATSLRSDIKDMRQENAAASASTNARLDGILSALASAGSKGERK